MRPICLEYPESPVVYSKEYGTGPRARTPIEEASIIARAISLMEYSDGIEPKDTVVSPELT